jgi:hypothetical protein
MNYLFLGFPIGPLINFILLGFISGLIGGIVFYRRNQSSKNVLLGGIFGTFVGIGIFTLILSILFFTHRTDVILYSAGISFIYLIFVFIISGFFYWWIGKES